MVFHGFWRFSTFRSPLLEAAAVCLGCNCIVSFWVVWLLLSLGFVLFSDYFLLSVQSGLAVDALGSWFWAAGGELF